MKCRLFFPAGPAESTCLTVCLVATYRVFLQTVELIIVLLLQLICVGMKAGLQKGKFI